LTTRASGPADVVPGRAALAQAVDGDVNGVIQVASKGDQVTQLVGIGVGHPLTSRSHDSAHEVNVLTDVRVPVRSDHLSVKPTLTRNGCQGYPDKRMRYLWWTEFQHRGAIHYHLVLIDPPFEQLRDARHWFDAHWRDELGRPLAGIQTWVDWRSGDWFRRRGGDYVLKDVRKLHGKRYEQDYARMPRGWRTFRSHQLAFSATEHQEHESKAWTVCTARPEAAWHERQLDIWVYRIDTHSPALGGCRLTRRRVRRPTRSEHGGDDVSTSSYSLVRTHHVLTGSTHGLTSSRSSDPEAPPG